MRCPVVPRSMRPSEPKKGPAVFGLALASAALYTLVFILCICSLSLPFYGQPYYQNDGTGFTLFFGLLAATCGAAVPSSLCELEPPVSYASIAADCTVLGFASSDPSCDALQAAGKSAAALGVAGEAAGARERATRKLRGKSCLLPALMASCRAIPSP